MNEEVDKVEIQTQRSQEGNLLSTFACIGCIFQHQSDFLGVPCCQSDKQEYADNADDEVEHGTLYKDVHDAGNDDADECHHHDAAHT